MHPFILALFFTGILAQGNRLDPLKDTRPDIYGLINILYLKADGNFDGTITETELGDVFHGFDKDGDGQVTEAEFIEIWMSITGQPRELAKAYFHLADLTDDAIIDSKDLPILYRVFDLNHDGTVSSQEFAKKWEDIVRESPFAVLFERADANTDEFLSHGEFNNLFASFDSNSDGMVSNLEFDAGWAQADFALMSDDDDLFASLDGNHDHSLDHADMPALFTRYDMDMNNKLSILEVIQMKSMLRLHSDVGPSG